MLDRLHHDDRVVDDETNRQNEAEERQSVDGKSEDREDRERSDERYRHRAERNERRSPVLEEKEHDEDHESERLEQGLDDVADSFDDRNRGVQRRLVRDVVGETL